MFLAALISVGLAAPGRQPVQHRRQAGVSASRRRGAWPNRAPSALGARRGHQDLDACICTSPGRPCRWPALTRLAIVNQTGRSSALITTWTHLLQDIRYAIRLCLRTPGLHRGGCDRAGPRHRRQHRDFHHRQRRPARAPAVPAIPSGWSCSGRNRRGGRAGRMSSAPRTICGGASVRPRSRTWRRSHDRRLVLSGSGAPEEVTRSTRDR